MSVQYVRRPRHLPHSDSHDRRDGPRVRDFILLFVAILAIGVFFVLLSLFQQSIGLHQVAAGVRIFGFLTLFVASGTGITAGLAYLLTGSLVKRELMKKMKRLDEEREALIQRMHATREDSDS